MYNKTWRKVEKEVGKKLIKLDEPAIGVHKPDTGDFHNWGNDILTQRLSIEVKTTIKKTFSLRADILQKVANRAKGEGKIPVLYIQTSEFIAYVFSQEVAEMLIEDHKVVEKLIEKNHGLFMELRSND